MYDTPQKSIPIKYCHADRYIPGLLIYWYSHQLILKGMMCYWTNLCKSGMHVLQQLLRIWDMEFTTFLCVTTIPHNSTFTCVSINKTYSAAAHVFITHFWYVHCLHTLSLCMQCAIATVHILEPLCMLLQVHIQFSIISIMHAPASYIINGNKNSRMLHYSLLEQLCSSVQLLLHINLYSYTYQ